MKTITINIEVGTGHYFVLVGDRFADRLTFEEALGLVAAEMIPGATRVREWRERERGRAVEVPVFDSAKFDEAMSPGHFETHGLGKADIPPGAGATVRMVRPTAPEADTECYFVGAVEPSAVVASNPHGFVAFRAANPEDAIEAVRLLNAALDELVRLKAAERARDAERMERLELSTKLTAAEKRIAELGEELARKRGEPPGFVATYPIKPRSP